MLKEQGPELSENVFSKLSDDLILNIFFKLEEDPRNWARLACVSTKFSSLARNVCCKTKCSQTIPAVVSDLISSAAASPPGGWPSLYKLAVCCPGLLHSGVLLENSDFGLERELGPDENGQSQSVRAERPAKVEPSSITGANPETSVTGTGCFMPGLVASKRDAGGDGESGPTDPRSGCFQSGQVTLSSNGDGESGLNVTGSSCCWSLFDDLLFDTMYDDSESSRIGQARPEDEDQPVEGVVVRAGCDFAVCKRRKISRSFRSHLAQGAWNLSREQGNKLLASRFKGDCLYICDWPGCIHDEERRNYMLFRGIFKNFKQSRVWRTINDGNRPTTDLNCAFCASKHTWDLHSAFCLRSYFGYHDDGDPVVRAYVCENGHVSGAWTHWPLYV